MTDWVAIFDRVFATPVSLVERRAFRAAFGDEYPDGLDTSSYVSRSELRRFVDELRVGPGDRFADVGCGRGGPGLWVAMQTGASLVGVDIVDSALAAATERASTLGLTDRSTFALGSFGSLPFDDGELDGVMSVDALLFAPDKAAAGRELARVMRAGGRLVLSTWDYHAQPAGRPPQVADHRPLLVAAGLDVLAYDETVDWFERQQGIDEALLRDITELAAETGVDPEILRAELTEEMATNETMLRRVLIVAARR